MKKIRENVDPKISLRVYSIYLTCQMVEIYLFKSKQYIHNFSFKIIWFIGIIIGTLMLFS